MKGAETFIAPVRFVPGDINQVIEESLDLIRHQFTRKKIDLAVTLDRNLPSVLLDPDQMKEVFVNLLLNAAQAIMNRGRMTIMTGRQRDGAQGNFPLVALSPCRPVGEWGEDGKWVAVMVADTGVGMSEEAQMRCFDPFFTTKADGTGLGLSIARRTVEQHRGIIAVESRIGEGSRFTVLLPLHESEGSPV
jgi:signal transduction histidine kinase